jgi:RNA polymerase sigma-70 factor (ECF subfamily)
VVVGERKREQFERVFRSSYRTVLGTAFLILRDRGRAEEVTQDAFLRLYERWGEGVLFDNPEAWVRRVVVRDAVRRAKRERIVPVTTVVDRSAGDDRARDLDLWRAIGALPAQQRAAVALYYLEDLPVGDVALLMSVAPATVRQHLLRARAHLAETLGETTEEVDSDVDR